MTNACSLPGPDREQLERLAALRRALRVLEERYGRRSDGGAGDDLERALGRRVFRIGHLRRQIEDMSRELARLEREAAGLRTGIEARLADAIDRFRDLEREAWSPVAVHGFRFWVRDGGVLRGFRSPWPSPELLAICETGTSPDEVPHTDGRCGRLGCGIYAVKDVDAILAEIRRLGARVGDAVTVGLVALTGKVVEHHLGYRGRHARVVALAAVERDRYALTADPAAIERWFAAARAMEEWMAARGEERWTEVAGFLERERERRSSWTSASSSG